MAAFGEARAHVRRNRLLHFDIAASECWFGESRLFERGLDVHAEVNNVGNELRLGLRLVPAAHDAEADMNVALLHKGRNDGVERALVSGKGIGQARREFEACAAAIPEQIKITARHARRLIAPSVSIFQLARFGTRSRSNIIPCAADVSIVNIPAGYFMGASASLAMVANCMFEVPSYILPILASRKYFSTG